MSRTLYYYYERELTFIRQLAQEFAKQYPGAAGRLRLEANRSTDPHVERLIEAFAAGGTGPAQAGRRVPGAHRLHAGGPLPPLPGPGAVDGHRSVRARPRPGSASQGIPDRSIEPAPHPANRRPAVQIPHGLSRDVMAGPGGGRQVHAAAVPRRCETSSRNGRSAQAAARLPGRPEFLRSDAGSPSLLLERGNRNNCASV